MQRTFTAFTTFIAKPAFLFVSFELLNQKEMHGRELAP